MTQGLLDDLRFEKRGGTVLRIPNLTTEEVVSLITYANSKIGHEYGLRFGSDTDIGE
ncbi:hypothetical protein FACS1894166_07220 [Bacilli bacterium]|nr:hypothetical protein FACS1894166_07220 [Bacilli bacterium]